MLIAALAAGCGAQSGETAEAPAETPDIPEAPETAELSSEIVLPAGWEISDAISASEVEELIGRTGYSYWHESLSDPAGGKPQGSYYDGTLAASKVNFLVYATDGPANFERVSGFIADPVEVPGDLWDRAIVGTMGGGVDEPSVGFLVLRGDACIRIKWEKAAYPELDPAETGAALANRLITNLYGGSRTM
jgi:hypothetical protein